MIKKQLPIPAELPSDLVFKVIEARYKGKYRATVVADKKLAIKKMYDLKYDSRAQGAKKLNFKDSGCFSLYNNVLTFEIDLGKQILFWASLLLIVVFVAVSVFNAFFLHAMILVCIPILFVWMIGLMRLNIYMQNELYEISRKLRAAHKSKNIK